jgi:3-oxoacyl-[acyl-carrier-protein] synthase-3
MQRELGLCRAQVTGAAQQGCASMFAALRNARALLTAEPSLRHVLCAGADVLPPGAPREILYNVISDAACAVVVSRAATRDRWIGFSQVSNGWCGDPIEHEAEIVAAYFPTARALVRELLAEHGLRPEDVDAVVPTGVHRAAWEILLRLVGIPVERLCRPAESFGHSIAADNFVILQELRRTGALEAGARVLLFTYGFGSTWSALLLEH